jgi:hypothetical protein
VLIVDINEGNEGVEAEKKELVRRRVDILVPKVTAQVVITTSTNLILRKTFLDNTFFFKKYV